MLSYERSTYLNDAGDKLFSNKEFIMTQVRGEPSPDLILDVEPAGSGRIYSFLKFEIVNSPQFTSFTLDVLIEETPDVLQIK